MKLKTIITIINILWAIFGLCLLGVFLLTSMSRYSKIKISPSETIGSAHIAHDSPFLNGKNNKKQIVMLVVINPADATFMKLRDITFIITFK